MSVILLRFTRPQCLAATHLSSPEVVYNNNNNINLGTHKIKDNQINLHAPGERVARIVLARRRRGDGSQCFYINIDIAILSLFLIVPKIRFIIIMHVNYSMIQ